REKDEALRYAETVPGRTTNAMCGLARELGVSIIIPLYEKAEGGKLFNSAAVADADGSLLGVYRKIHIPHDEFFYEKNYFEPGDLGFKIFNVQGADIAVLICYDQWFPEAARACALLGAQMIFYPTAIGRIRGYDSPDGDWLDAWTTVQRGHAIANAVHVCAVNRTGVEGELQFWGNSFISDPFGAVISKAGEGEETIVAEVDLARNTMIREGWGFMRNRRPDCYGEITKGERGDE
ncbi:MAG TPA: nitrilase-related carbon-nitrogen hydrolase, partial [bacterium]|nr:nitrilase-related carbon-nitrogen hydrolase [bacterium]